MPWKPGADPGPGAPGRRSGPGGESPGRRPGWRVVIPGGPSRRLLAAAVVLGAALPAACAREEPPPGALPDSRPPQVVEVVPGRDTVAPGFGGAAGVRFDEPVNFPGDLGRQLVASPAYRWEVETGFSDVRIEPEGGWRDDVVYCFELPDGISDLIRNRTESPIAFCFSTGPPVTETVVEGRVVDRLTGSAEPRARVLFLALPGDTTPYQAVSGQDGSFRLRALPPATYWAYAFQDRNRNLRLDRALEPHDSASFELEGASATASLELALTEADSTPPEMVAARSVDRLTVRLQFDDALDPEADPGSVTVRSEDEEEAWPVEWVRLGEPTSFPPPDTAAAGGAGGADTTGAAMDTAGAAMDTAGATADTAEVARDRTAGAARTAGAGGLPADTAARPSRVLTVRLARPLEEGVYRVLAEGWSNLRGLVGGGDTTFVHPFAEDVPGEPSPSGPPRRRPR